MFKANFKNPLMAGFEIPKDSVKVRVESRGNYCLPYGDMHPKVLKGEVKKDDYRWTSRGEIMVYINDAPEPIRMIVLLDELDVRSPTEKQLYEEAKKIRLQQEDVNSPFIFTEIEDI